MSQRGSFITGYIYCDKCLGAVANVLLKDNKWLCSVQIPSWDGEGKLLPVIAGKVGGLYVGEEIDVLKRCADEIARHICHSVQIAVLPENGESSVITIQPGGKGSM